MGAPNESSSLVVQGLSVGKKNSKKRQCDSVMTPSKDIQNKHPLLASTPMKGNTDKL